jgi:hypothetical protein
MKSKIVPIVFLIVLILACSNGKRTDELLSYPLNDLTGVIDQSHVTFDKDVSSDGKGSLRIVTTVPAAIALFEVHNINIDNARLLYQARVKVQNVIGQVYLEMWCHFPEKGEFFSRGQATLMSGTADWTSQEAPFFLQQGEKPDYVKLNLVINGHGTAWIDDIKLIKAPLK